MASHKPIAQKLLQRHPLQRLESPSRSLSAFVHGAGLANFIYAFHYLVDNHNPINDSYGWHLQYLTIIGLAFALITFSLGLIADITLSRRLFYLKNVVSATSAPMEILISVLYWTIRAIDPSLLIQDFLPQLSLPVDAAFHAFPAVFLTIDLLFLSPPWTIGAIPSMGLSSVIAVLYWFWTERNAALNGFYPYPIFDVSTELRLGLFGISVLIMTASFISLKWLYRVANGSNDIPPATNERSGKIRGD